MSCMKIVFSSNVAYTVVMLRFVWFQMFKIKALETVSRAKELS